VCYRFCKETVTWRFEIVETRFRGRVSVSRVEGLRWDEDYHKSKIICLTNRTRFEFASYIAWSDNFARLMHRVSIVDSAWSDGCFSNSSLL